MSKKELLAGNEAIGRGAIEAGISYAASYPGTPATEILEYLAKHFDGEVDWSLNEKIALESAIGASYTGKRAICSMKHVGLNVASDPLMTAPYLGVKGGLVIVVADDPGAYSSQNEQDTRIYARFAKVPCFEPSDGQEAKDMVITAFELSEKFGIPVIVRSLTRLSHGMSPVEIGTPRDSNKLNLQKDPEHLLATPSNVIRLHKVLVEKQPQLVEWGETAGVNKVFKQNQKKGIIASGIAFTYGKEYAEDYAFLKIGYYPFPEKLIAEFVKDLEEVWVLEEGEPIIEEITRRYSNNVKGKLTGELNRVGELGPDCFTWAQRKPVAEPSKPKLPIRPPVLCPGCGHRETYKALNAAKPTFVTGDIGCYTLGANPPLSAMDTCLCMGASISQATGIAKQGVKRVAAAIGDSTFLHGGIPALINAVYNKANITVVIMDNDSTAMTGHQPTPLTGITAKGEQGGKIVLEDLCKACRADTVDVVEPFDGKKTQVVFEQALGSDGVHVVIARHPCVLVTQRLKKK
ncbi:MAG: thiamine pyrophosphate-dependent enzyme [bacterium]